MTFLNWCTSCLSDAVHNDAESAANHLAALDNTAWAVLASVSIALGVLFAFTGYSVFYLTVALVGLLAGSVVAFGLVCGATSNVIAAICTGVAIGLASMFLVYKVEKL